MLSATKAIIEKVPSNYHLILSKTVKISEDMELTCGYDAATQFKPTLLLKQNTDADRKEEIKFNLGEWLGLCSLKTHIDIQLSTNHPEPKRETFTIPNIDSTIFTLQYNRHFVTTLTIRQLGWQIEVDSDDWTKIFQHKELVDAFFLWSEYARNTIFDFYTNYIQACITQNSWFLTEDKYHTVLPNHKKGYYIRLCHEFESLKCKIRKDISRALIHQ